MNAKQIEKHLDKLTERERAVLSLNAWGRKDETEAARLLDTAPRVNLSAPDCGRVMQRLVNVIEWHALAQAQNAANLFLILHWLDADKKRKKPEADFEEWAVQVTAHKIIARADAWRIFCGELGLDPVGAFRIASADVVLLKAAEEIARQIKPDLDVIRKHARAVLGEKFVEQAKLQTAEEIAAEYRLLLNGRP